VSLPVSGEEASRGRLGSKRARVTTTQPVVGCEDDDSEDACVSDGVEADGVPAVPKRGRGRGHAGAVRGRGRGVQSAKTGSGRGRGRGRPRGALSAVAAGSQPTNVDSFETIDTVGALDHVRLLNVSQALFPVDEMTWEVLQNSWGRPTWPLECAVNDGVITCSTCGPAWAADVISNSPYSDGSTNRVCVAVAPLRRDDPMPSLLPTSTTPAVNGIQFWNAEVLAPYACRSTKLGREAGTQCGLAFVAVHTTSHVKAMKWNAWTRWNPSLDGRLGILAAIHGDGCLRVYAVPDLESPMVADICVRPDAGVNAGFLVPWAFARIPDVNILCMDWSPSNPCQFITGNSDGVVASSPFPCELVLYGFLCVCWSGSVCLWSIAPPETTCSGVLVPATTTNCGFVVMDGAMVPPVIQLIPLARYITRGCIARPFSSVAVLSVTWIPGSRRKFAAVTAESALRFWSFEDCFEHLGEIALRAVRTPDFPFVRLTCIDVFCMVAVLVEACEGCVRPVRHTSVCCDGRRSNWPLRPRRMQGSFAVCFSLHLMNSRRELLAFPASQWNVLQVGPRRLGCEHHHTVAHDCHGRCWIRRWLRSIVSLVLLLWSLPRCSPCW
jgi:hypothetical protein